LKGTYANIEQGKWTFDKPLDHPHQFYAPHHPPSPEARDLITKLLRHNYQERATIETIETHPFLSARLPSTLPISALKVPPLQHDTHDIHGMETEPRLLFVCLEPTNATRQRRAAAMAEDDRESSELLVSEVLAKPRPTSRWRCCIAGAPAPLVPPDVRSVSRADSNGGTPSTHSDLSTDTSAQSDDEDTRVIRVRSFPCQNVSTR
jgi:serine/threonine protein kinase